MSVVARTDNAGKAHEIILVNAHDGTSSYQMISGVFRFVCANGLFAGDAFEDLKVRHTGNAVGRVIEGTYTVLDDTDAIMADVAERECVRSKVRYLSAAIAQDFEAEVEETPEPPQEALAAVETYRARQVEEAGRPH